MSEQREPVVSDKLPEPVRSQMAALMALRDLNVERDRADRMRGDSNTLYEIRGWLRLCEDTPEGHAEFYQWACHYIFGDEPPGEDSEPEPSGLDEFHPDSSWNKGQQ